MKFLFFLSVIITSTASIKAQNKFIGHYEAPLNGRIDINSDSTFLYSYHFDLMSSWTKGTWKIINDTIYFIAIPIYDTVNYFKTSSYYKQEPGYDTLTHFKNSIQRDTLILSGDDKPERTQLTESIVTILSGGGQNRHVWPEELFYQNEKLYQIANGKLVKQKIKGFWTNAYYDPWFIKKK